MLKIANRKSLVGWILIVVITILIIIGFIWWQLSFKKKDSIKVGVLHSLTGTMAISEKSLVDAVLLKIEEINKEGGILGQQIEPIVVDGKSDWKIFAEEAERLIVEEKVSVIFGCWTSACRKSVQPIFEKHNHLLIYPIPNEGLEQSPNIIYTGAAPNQRITPAVKWAFDNLGSRFFLVGSDRVFSRTANEIIKDQIVALNGEVVGEEYALLGSTDFDLVSEKIVEASPDVILNTINGDSNIVFFESLHYAARSLENMNTSNIFSVISFGIAEDELRTFKEYLRNSAESGLSQIDDREIEEYVEHIWSKHVVGSYAVWNYFQSLETEENKRFVQQFKEKYGQDRTTDDPIEAAYLGVHLWSQVVKSVGTKDVHVVRNAIKGQCLNAPEGIVCIDSKNNHTWKTVRIGKIRDDGQFDIIWNSEKPIRPEPYPASRLIVEWDQFLEDLYIGWGGNWANPGN